MLCFISIYHPLFCYKFFFFFRVPAGDDADWGRALQSAAMYNIIELKNWFCITTSRLQRETRDFIAQLQNVSRGLQFPLREPVMYVKTIIRTL